MRISDWSSDVCSSDLWEWPFADTMGESPDWAWLVLDAFGTRYTVVATVFLNHLIDLCGWEWDEEKQIWVPDDGELNAILHIVAAQKQKNEAQKDLPAQTAATHIRTMMRHKHVHPYPPNNDSNTYSEHHTLPHKSNK